MPAKVTTLVPAGQAVPATPNLAYKPKRADWALLEAFQAVIASSGRLSNAELARHLGITADAVRQRLLMPARQEWINEQLERATQAAWPRIMARAGELAMRGSIDHMNFLAKVGGKFAQPEGGAGGDHSGPTYVFNCLVPRR